VLRARLVQEQILRDEEVEVAEPLLDVMRVRLGLRRVLADQVQRPNAPVVESGHHLVEAVTRPRGNFHAPRLRELLADLRALARLVAREVGRIRAGVVQPLDVVLAS
jgi:hypothetical protein